jgi:hypothetical protein
VVKLTSGGALSLYQTGTNITSVTLSADPKKQFVQLRVFCEGSRIRVSADDTPVIDVTNSTYASGYVSLVSYSGPASFDAFEITTRGLRTPLPDVSTQTNRYYGWSLNEAGVYLAPGDDEDGDSLLNITEFYAGTDPLSGTHIRPIQIDTANKRLRILHRTGLASLTSRILRRASLVNGAWTETSGLSATPISAGSEWLDLNLDPSDAQQFFKLELSRIDLNVTP